MRAVEFVGRADEEIAFHGLHVDEFVGGEVNRINKAKRTAGVREPGHFAHWGYCAQRIGGRADGNQAGPVVDRTFEFPPDEFAGVWVEWHGTDADKCHA